ncbi:ShlB/FhaC/HecB family hemolysin secretion/activation protein [Serratia ureilytica]|uniref:ShlB/FhaC/HecB family hemolysin secretion/activation protein n=1 Tax=Serratia ureilytica TaxID=300181 RepID=UPI002F968E56
MNTKNNNIEINYNPSTLSSFIYRLLQRNDYFRTSMGCILLAFCPTVLSAALPNAGQAMRDIEETRLSVPPPVEMKSPSPPTRSLSATLDNSPSLLVSGFILTGNKSIPTTQILPLLEGFKRKKLTVTQLKTAVQQVTLFYRERGYVLANAYLPKQEIVNGQVRIDIVEGYYGNITVDNDSQIRDGVLRWQLSNVRSGMPITDAQLERNLLLLNDIPGVLINSTLSAGPRPGTTDWQIRATPGARVDGVLQADNFGDAYTGEYRGSASLGVNNPLWLGDRLDLRLLSSDKHQRYYRMAYQLPVSPWATRAGIGHSYMNYRLGKDFNELKAHGNASLSSAFLIQPLLRSRTLNVNAQLQFDDKKLRDDIDLFESRSRKRISLWTAGVDVNAQDRLFDGGQSVVSLSYGIGNLHIEDPSARRWDGRTAKTEGPFSKLTLSALRLQNLGDAFQLYAQFNTQWAPGNLDSSEKFSVGGPYGVRAYAPGSGNGDLGWQASMELRYALRPGWQLSTFVDQGQARLNRRTWTTEKNRVHMSAAGSSLTWGGINHQVGLTAAWPIAGSGPGSDTDKSPRIWLQAARYF